MVATQPKPTPKPEPDETDAVNTHAPPKPAGQNALTFGEKAVGLTFNPSGDPIVEEIKRGYAKLIDLYHMKRQSLMAGSEAHRLYAVAITTAQDAQMWGVKAATWKD